MLKRPLVPATALLWGLQFAFLSPALALIMVSLYGATPAEVGWVLAVYNAGGFVAALVIPAWADRRHRYLPVLVVCAVLTVALAVALALATSLVVAALALVVLGGPAGVGMSMLYAHLRHSGASPRVIVNTRALISFAWVAGPPIATAVIGWFGNRAILLVVAAVGVLTTVLAVVLMRRSRDPDNEPDAGGPSAADVSVAPMSRPRVAVVVVAFVLAQATNAAAVAVMTLFVTEHLGLPVIWAGLALGLAAGLEIPALLVMGRLSARFSSLGLLVTGFLAAVVYYAGMILVPGPIALLALQVPNAWFFAAVAGVGITLFQDLIPRPGLATGLYTNTRRVGSILAGPVIAMASSPLGYPGVFATCAGMALVAVVATWGAGRTRPVADDTASDPAQLA